MESVFGINMVALVDGRPQLLNLKQMLEAFVRHRREVVTRRTIFELRKARARAHILEGLTVALANIDEMIELIKTSESPQVAKDRMLAKSWEPGLVRALLGAVGAEASRPEDLPTEFGLLEDGYQPDRSAGQGNPGDAPEPPDRAGAGKADRRIPPAAGDHRAA